MAASNEDVLAEFATLCSPLGDISGKSMFGGLGVFCDGLMFALITRHGELFLKADDENRATFENEGLARFGKMPYYAAPTFVRKNWRSMKSWAEGALAAAERSAKSKKKDRPPA